MARAGCTPQLWWTEVGRGWGVRALLLSNGLAKNSRLPERREKELFWELEVESCDKGLHFPHSPKVTPYCCSPVPSSMPGLFTHLSSHSSVHHYSHSSKSSLISLFTCCLVNHGFTTY